jgi:hypothetical protein
MKTKTNPMQRPNCQPQALRQCKKCGAKTRRGTPYASPAVALQSRCRMHGGAQGSGAPCGKRNGAYRTGAFAKAAIKDLRTMRALVRESREMLDDIG